MEIIQSGINAIPKGYPVWLGAPLVLFIWEHVALTNNSKVRPTVAINQVTRACRATWRYMGRGFAYMGVYYRYLHLDKLSGTFSSFAKSFKDLAFSVAYFFKGFGDVAKNYNYPVTLGFCSLLTLGVSFWLFQTYKGSLGDYLSA